MSKIIISEMSYQYIDYYHPIFEGVNLSLNTDWKLGLIGRNGRGKTTLLKLIQGNLLPDTGQILTSVEVNYFPYVPNTTYTLTLDVLKENIGHLKSMEDEMEEIITTNNPEQFDRYSELVEHYTHLGGYEMEGDIQKELRSMDLDPSLLDRPFATLSGGEQTKILLIALFLRKNRFILLDEPTNHLDLEGKDILAQYLQKKKGFIIVSHDTAFLDQIIDHVLSINKTTITLEKGTYTSWLHNKTAMEQFERRTKERLEHEISQLERSSKANRDWAAIGNTQKYTFAGNARSNGAKAYMRQAKHSEARIQNNIDAKKNLLLNFEELKPLHLAQDTADSDWYIKIKELNFFYTEDKPIIRHLNFDIHPEDRIWIRGKNGSGKSTLLRLLLGQLHSPSISFAENITLTYAGQEPAFKFGYIDQLIPATDLEKFKSICEIFELPDDYLERPLQTYSSGELKKVDISKALCSTNQILVLDEPLNYMDNHFREQLAEAILKYKPTLIFVEHNQLFSKRIATRILSL